jgi:hypothetical protein
MSKLLCALVALSIFAACVKATYLAPQDAAILVNAKREATFIVTRQDGGMPHADRIFASETCKSIAKVLTDSSRDAGGACP